MGNTHLVDCDVRAALRLQPFDRFPALPDNPAHEVWRAIQQHAAHVHAVCVRLVGLVRPRCVLRVGVSTFVRPVLVSTALRLLRNRWCCNEVVDVSFIDAVVLE